MSSHNRREERRGREEKIEGTRDDEQESSLINKRRKLIGSWKIKKKEKNESRNREQKKITPSKITKKM